MSWADVDGYEGIYTVSDAGEVMSMNYAKSKLPGLMTQVIRRGYPSVYFRRPGVKGRWFTVHALVAAAFIGPRPDGLTVNHIDGNKQNNDVKNLEYVTHSENSKHSFRIGLQDNKGEKHSQAKLSNAKVIEIRGRVRSGETQTAVARDFGVDQGTISNIVLGKSWSHVASGGVL